MPADAERVLARRREAAAHTARVDAERLARWEALLTDLDARVDHAEQLLVTSGDSAADPIDAEQRPWSAPADAGGLPPELLARATALAARQQEVVDKLTAAATSHRKEARLVDTMKMDGDSFPVYLDRAG